MFWWVAHTLCFVSVHRPFPPNLVERRFWDLLAWTGLCSMCAPHIMSSLHID